MAVLLATGHPRRGSTRGRVVGIGLEQASTGEIEETEREELDDALGALGTGQGSTVAFHGDSAREDFERVEPPRGAGRDRRRRRRLGGTPPRGWERLGNACRVPAKALFNQPVEARWNAGTLLFL
jgi:hypothetical protein